MKKIAYPGTFDPFHNGHKMIVSKLIKMFDEVYIIIFDNSSKNTSIDIKLRFEAINILFKEFDNIKVIYSYDSLSNELEKNDINIIGRGVRNSEDIVIEMQRSTMISKIYDVETIFIPTTPDVSFISSSIIRELIILNKDISSFVPKNIENLYNN